MPLFSRKKKQKAASADPVWQQNPIFDAQWQQNPLYDTEKTHEESSRTRTPLSGLYDQLAASKKSGSGFSKKILTTSMP